jgi:Fe-S cluster biosynthesis and repair protein YggX
MNMTKCSKCGNDFDESQVDPAAAEYSSCSSCWDEWVKYSIMVINEMRLDMSLPEHRKALRKHERVYFGLEKLEAGMKDLSKEEERVPDER